MRSSSHSGATIAPTYSPQTLQAARVRSRIALPDAMARTVASLAFGEPRGDVWAWPASGASVGGRAHG